MGVKTIFSTVASSWSTSTTSKISGIATDADVERDQRPLLRLEVPRSGPSHANRSYGATHASGLSSKASLDRLRRDNLLIQVPEEDPAELGEEENEDETEEDELELEEFGLFRGSYNRLVTLYTIVPLSCLLVFVALALLPNIYPPHSRDSYPHPSFFPFPLPELLTSASLWSFSHLLRVPLFSLFTALISSELAIIVLSTTFHVIVHNALRLTALPILLVRHQMDYPYPTWRDPSFRRVWWLALGWSLAEVIVGVAQGYEQIGFYRDVLVAEGKDEEFLRIWNAEVLPESPGKGSPNEGQYGTGLHTFPRGGPPSPQTERTILLQTREEEPRPTNADVTQSLHQFRVDNAIKSQVDRDLDHLMALKGREEIEEVYGIPVIKIPVFVSCLQRINSIIVSLGLTLLLSAAYLRSPLSLSTTFGRPPINHLVASTQTSNRSFYITVPIVILLHTFLSLLHTSLFLPRIGVHTAAYIGLLIGLGSLFAGLGLWEALS
jgi:hypothetical protein